MRDHYPAGRACPELAYVGAEFDRMVEALHRSAAEIRHTAEENAHAFKTPIVVIRQSLEPLRRALAEDNPRAQRAIGVVEHLLDRLVAASLRLDERCASMSAKQRVAASRAEQPDDLACKRSWLRSNFVARRPDETEDRRQRIANPGNVGLLLFSRS